MAKFTFTKNLSDHGLLPVFYDTPSMHVTANDSTSITYTDTQGDHVVYHGTGFASANGPEAADGSGLVIDKIQYFNAAGKLLLTVTGNFDGDTLTFDDVSEDIVTLQGGADRFIGTRSNDYMLYGLNSGKDTFIGKGGNDTFLGSPGNNSYDGGSGKLDTLSFDQTFPVMKFAAGATTGIKADLAHGMIKNPWGGTDHIRGVEAVHGTLKKDTFIGSAANEFFTGYAGSDRFTGGAGKDTFDFTSGDGHDTFTDFGNGRDKILLYGYNEIADFDELKTMMEQHGSKVVLTLSETDSMTFLDTKINQLHASEFTIFHFG